jgi:nucleotide-binding universal stress UspA family protein
MAAAARTLVVGIDDTDDSEYAFNWLLKNLYRDGDEVHLCHIIPRMQFAAVYGVPPVDFYPVVSDPEEYEKVVKRAEEFVSHRFTPKLVDYPNLRPVVHIIKSETDTDSVGHVLCKKAEDVSAACLVVASHNKGRLAEVFLGSVTQYCIHHSKRPVVVVRQ